METYKDIFTTPISVQVHFQVKHSIDLIPSLPLPNELVYMPSLMENETIKFQIQELIQKDHILPSSSPCGRPIKLVHKKYGTWGLCINYRDLNNITIQNRYPIFQIDNLLDQINGAKYFNNIDLKFDHHKVEIEHTYVEDFLQILGRPF